MFFCFVFFNVNLRKKIANFCLGSLIYYFINENVDNPSIRIYVNKIENRITFTIKNGYYLELLTPDTMKLLASTESEITKDKNGENVLHLGLTELVLIHCNLVNNGYQQDSRILYTFVPNKPFGILLEISPTNHIFLKTFNSGF